MIRTEQNNTRAEETGDKSRPPGAAEFVDAGEIPHRGSVYRCLSQLIQQGWKLEKMDRQNVKLSKPGKWRKTLFIAGFLFLPLMGFGLLLWALALGDTISGSKEYLSFSFSDIRERKKPVRGRLNRLQHISLAGFGSVFSLWLMAALPLLLPQTFNAVLPVTAEIAQDLNAGFKMDGVLAMPVGYPLLPGPPDAVLNAPSSTSTQAAEAPAATLTPLMPAVQTATSTLTPTPTPTATFTPTSDPNSWKDLPVVPKLSSNWLDIYEKGRELGNNPRAFSVVGDCQSVPYLFMGMYDGTWYSMENLDDGLQETVEFFQGSYSRYGMTIIDGGTAATMLMPGWANRNWCDVNESSLDCELRLHKPSFVIINIGTHWTARNDDYVRTMVEKIIEKGAIPVLATKGDNLESDNHVNRQIARIASEYDIPLWNLWRAVHDLPGHGLDPYRQGGNMYYSSVGLVARRMSALQVLDKLRQAVD